MKICWRCRLCRICPLFLTPERQQSFGRTKSDDLTKALTAVGAIVRLLLKRLDAELPEQALEMAFSCFDVSSARSKLSCKHGNVTMSKEVNSILGLGLILASGCLTSPPPAPPSLRHGGAKPTKLLSGTLRHHHLGCDDWKRVESQMCKRKSNDSTFRPPLDFPQSQIDKGHAIRTKWHFATGLWKYLPNI